MLKLDLGGVGSGGAWTTINLDSSGYRPAPDVVASITASANELSEYFDFGTVDAIRCIHTLEHLPQWDIMPTLQYWHKLLKPGGELLIVVPDMGRMAEQYADAELPFEVFAAVTYVSGFRTKQGPQEEHRWGWDVDTLANDLLKAGFRSPEMATDYPAAWLFDFPDMMHTGCVGRYEVPNLRVRAKA